MSLLCILCTNKFCNGLQLDYARSFVNSTNLSISVHTLQTKVFHVAHTTSPLNRLACHFLCNLWRIIFCHRRILHKVLVVQLFACCVVYQQTCGLQLCCTLCMLHLHSLKITNILPKLLALKNIWHDNVKRTLSNANHLCPYPNSPFV